MPADLPTILRQVREIHQHATEGVGAPGEHRAHLQRLVAELEDQRELVHTYTVDQARELRTQVQQMLQEMHSRDWVNMGTYQTLQDVYNALNFRVEDLGAPLETADRAVNFAQTGAVFSTGMQVLTPVLGTIGGPILGTMAGAGVMWLPEQIGKWAEKAGANRRLVTTLTRLGILGGAVALAPAYALPAAVIGGVVGGFYYLLNRFSAEDARQVRPAMAGVRA